MSYSWGDDSSTSWDGGGFDYGEATNSYDDEKSYVSKNIDMGDAYKVSSKVMNMAMSKSDKNLLNKLAPDDIVVVRGSYDSVEKVLDAAGTSYKMAKEGTRLDPRQVLLVNCEGSNVSMLRYKKSKGTDAVRKFVKDGGFVVSTDWALEQLVETAFDGFVSHAGRDTDDDVVEVDLVAEGSPYTKGLGNGALKPVWWLEGASYPIGINKSNSVDILLGSREMEQKYGENPIAIKFPFGEGRVLHVTSHFYLQTMKAKYEAQYEKTGEDFVKSFVGLPKKSVKNLGKLDSLTFGAMESAYTSLRFLHNVFLEKMKRNQKNLKTMAAAKGKTLHKTSGKTSKGLLPGK